MNENIGFFHEGQPEAIPAAAFGVAALFVRPEDVVDDLRLTRAEKKAILASWCSDARAVENAPKLRRLDSGAIVEVDEILRALASLDRAAPEPKRRAKWLPAAAKGRNAVTRWLSRARTPHRSNDNDDDPPPAPAGLGVPFRPSFVAAHAARPDMLRAALGG